MKFVAHALRILLGLDFLLNAINFYHPFFHITVPANEAARALMGGMLQSGVFELVKAIEITAGFLLLVNRFVPLALMMVAPLTVVIFIVDCVLIATPEGFAFGGTTTVLVILVLIAYLKHFLGLLAFRADPATPSIAELAAAIAAPPEVA